MASLFQTPFFSLKVPTVHFTFAGAQISSSFCYTCPLSIEVIFIANFLSLNYAWHNCIFLNCLSVTWNTIP